MGCLCVSVCPPLFFEMASPTLLKLGGWVDLGLRKKKFAFVRGSDAPKVKDGVICCCCCCCCCFCCCCCCCFAYFLGDGTYYASEIWWVGVAWSKEDHADVW